MTSREGRHRTNLEIPVEVKEAMKDDDDPMWKVVEKAVRMYKGLDEASTEHALNRRIEEKEQRIEHLEEERDQITQELEKERELKADLEEKRDTIREKKQSHRERLDDILDEMLTQTNKNVLAWMSELKEAAKEEYGTTSSSNIERVVGDLRTRRDERNLAIPDHRFQRTGTAPNSGVSKADGDGGPQLKSVQKLETDGGLGEEADD